MKNSRKISEFYFQMKELDVTSEYSELDGKLGKLKGFAPAEGKELINKIEIVSA